MADITVMKIGNHTVDFSKEQNHNAEEIKDLIKLLASNKQNTIRYYGKIRGKFDNVPSNVLLYDIVKPEFSNHSLNGLIAPPVLDHVFLINSSINFFGGKDDPYTLKTFDLVARAKNITFYFVDSLLGFHTDLDISKRDWKDKYTDLTLHVPEQTVKAITHYYDFDAALKKIQKTKRDKKTVPYFTKDSIHHFPMYKWHYLLMPEKTIKDELKYDLTFGGNPRHKLRLNAMDKYLLSCKNVNVDLFGSCTPEHFGKTDADISSNVKFNGTITFNELIENYSSSVATVLLADLDSDKMFTGRIGHSPLAGVPLLVEESCDPKHMLFGDMKVYFNTVEELEQLTIGLKNNPTYRRELVEKQRKCVKYTWEELREFFENIILK